MPRGGIERIVEPLREHTPAARPQRSARRGGPLDPVDPSPLELGLRRLGNDLIEADPARCATAVGTGLELLGLAFEARRVVFYRAADPASGSAAALTGGGARRPSESALEAERLWTAEAGLLDGPLEAPPLPAEALRVEAPAPSRCVSIPPWRGEDDPRGGGDERGETVWRSGVAWIVLPVPGAKGPWGAFLIEAGRLASRWSPALRERGALLAGILGSAFDRAALAAEVERLRAGAAHHSRLECLGRVASGVAHDFNNVLTAIQGYADLLEIELEEGASGREELAEIRAAAERAATLVDRVLRFGRRRAPRVERIDLGETLEALQGLVRRVLGRGIELHLEIESGLPRVSLDPGALEPAVMNLAANARGALAARGGGGHFTLALHRAGIDDDGREVGSGEPVPGLSAGDYLRLSAGDDGCGIDPALRARIFEPFFTTKAPGEGTGLGLVSLMELLRATRGGLRLESAPGEGTTFHLYFPIASTRDA